MTGSNLGHPTSIRFDDPRVWDLCLDVLDGGGCIVVPTDTVYGIASHADNPSALQRVKGRTDAFPPPILIADIEAAWELVHPVRVEVERLARRFWPGPLTLILPTDRTDLSLAHDIGTLGLRVPDHNELRELLRRTGPLVVSSANKHGHQPATTVEEAISQLGDEVGLYVDSGPTPGPSPSTVVDCQAGIEVVRVGLIPREQILATAGGHDA